MAFGVDVVASFEFGGDDDCADDDDVVSGWSALLRLLVLGLVVMYALMTRFTNSMRDDSVDVTNAFECWCTANVAFTSVSVPRSDDTRRGNVDAAVDDDDASNALAINYTTIHRACNVDQALHNAVRVCMCYLLVSTQILRQRVMMKLADR